jgi:hypothetical protein
MAPMCVPRHKTKLFDQCPCGWWKRGNSVFNNHNSPGIEREYIALFVLFKNAAYYNRAIEVMQSEIVVSAGAKGAGLVRTKFEATICSSELGGTSY